MAFHTLLMLNLVLFPQKIYNDFPTIFKKIPTSYTTKKNQQKIVYQHFPQQLKLLLNAKHIQTAFHFSRFQIKKAAHKGRP